jgi:hypothetical protein
MSHLTEYGGRKITKTAPFAVGAVVAALAIFLGIHIPNANAKAVGSEQEKAKQPDIQQNSSGSKSPNVVGNRNNINNGDHVTINLNAPASLPQPTFQEESEDISFSLGERGFTDTETIEALKKGPHTPFLFDGFSPVTVTVKGGVLLYDIKFWGGTGKPPIEVKNNKFIVRVPAWDRNFNANAFEVVDSNNVPILQVIRKTPSHIIVNGIFLLPNGLLLPAGPKGVIIGVKVVPPDFLLKPIFRYPAWKYPGQTAD